MYVIYITNKTILLQKIEDFMTVCILKGKQVINVMYIARGVCVSNTAILSFPLTGSKKTRLKKNQSERNTFKIDLMKRYYSIPYLFKIQTYRN